MAESWTEASAAARVLSGSVAALCCCTKIKRPVPGLELASELEPRYGIEP
jgi:hypothetical protein